ncbi:MAG: protein kinase [Anaerolineae bacterium]|nr:protein kinase [Anaerolineae bacterium]
MPLPDGYLLGNRYKIETTLTTKGGMGIVYRAFDTNLQIPVAIKENLIATTEAQEQFAKEAHFLALLSHQNLPRVFDHLWVEDKQYLIMDFVEGEDLHDRLTRLGALPEDQVLPWILQICDALSYLHSQSPPLIHRDVKPHNIKVRPDNRAILVDFGIAKVHTPDSSTRTGAKGVSSGYSPPEQRFRESTDTRSDIYALGATLYHLLTGQKPPDSLKLYKDNLVSPYNVSQQISPAVERAIIQAMALDKESRFQTIEDFRAALCYDKSQQKDENVSPQIDIATPTDRPKRKQVRAKKTTPRPSSKKEYGQSKPAINFDDLVQQFKMQVSQVCRPQTRYRTLWLVGPPRSGKTLLSQAVCQQANWQYINFTLESGFLDSLIGREGNYRPKDFEKTLEKWLNTDKEIIIFDEIEPLLGWWNWKQQQTFFEQIGWLTRLQKGLVFVTRLRKKSNLLELLPGVTHIFEMPKGVLQ